MKQPLSILFESPYSSKKFARLCQDLAGTCLVVQRLGLGSQGRDPGLVPGQGTGSHVPQLRVCMQQLKIPRATAKMEDPAWCNWGPRRQISKWISCSVRRSRRSETSPGHFLPTWLKSSSWPCSLSESQAYSPSTVYRPCFLSFLLQPSAESLRASIYFQ